MTFITPVDWHEHKQGEEKDDDEDSICRGGQNNVRHQFEVMAFAAIVEFIFLLLLRLLNFILKPRFSYVIGAFKRTLCNICI